MGHLLRAGGHPWGAEGGTEHPRGGRRALGTRDTGGWGWGNRGAVRGLGQARGTGVQRAVT